MGYILPKIYNNCANLEKVTYEVEVLRHNTYNPTLGKVWNLIPKKRNKKTIMMITTKKLNLVFNYAKLSEQ